MADWQPIESAPKNGADIFLYNELWEPGGFRNMQVGFWNEILEMWDFDTGLNVEEEWELPTHWAPLPEPPSSVIGQSEKP